MQQQGVCIYIALRDGEQGNCRVSVSQHVGHCVQGYIVYCVYAK